jgi:HJR/Mrr/RecB family endonuclease
MSDTPEIERVIARFEKQRAGLSPEEYMAAVKTHPQAITRGSVGGIYDGYAIRRSGDHVDVIPECLGKDNLRSFAALSTPPRLYASGGCRHHVASVIFGKLPSKEQLRAFYVGKHGKGRGDSEAAQEWFDDQLKAQHGDAKRKAEMQRIWQALPQKENAYGQSWTHSDADFIPHFIGDMTDSEKKALLRMTECAKRPQPADYGLTYDDVHPSSVGIFGYSPKDDLNYRKGRRWFGVLSSLKFFLATWLAVYWLAYVAVSADIDAVRGFFNVSSASLPHRLTLGGAIVMGFLVTLYLGLVWGSLWAKITRYKQKHPNAVLSAYQRAVRLHELYKAVLHEAEQADLRKKRSYWAFLDGYAFEKATAEILKRYNFDPRVTPGSGDGGVDIEVARNGLRGVVQCKAHASCVGPHVVRDLFGVIHHSQADFGIIVSRGGFSKGAVDFARDKPILFLDISDLIAMQEGKDVLAAAFSRNPK